jgi:hypothetical protein
MSFDGFEDATFGYSEADEREFQAYLSASWDGTEYSDEVEDEWKNALKRLARDRRMFAQTPRRTACPAQTTRIPAFFHYRKQVRVGRRRRQHRIRRTRAAPQEEGGDPEPCDWCLKTAATRTEASWRSEACHA